MYWCVGGWKLLRRLDGLMRATVQSRSGYVGLLSSGTEDALCVQVPLLFATRQLMRVLVRGRLVERGVGKLSVLFS